MKIRFKIFIFAILAFIAGICIDRWLSYNFIEKVLERHYVRLKHDINAEYNSKGKLKTAGHIKEGSVGFFEIYSSRFSRNFIKVVVDNVVYFPVRVSFEDSEDVGLLKNTK